VECEQAQADRSVRQSVARSVWVNLLADGREVVPGRENLRGIGRSAPGESIWMCVFAGDGPYQESDSYYNRGLKLAGRDPHRFLNFVKL
jgi:hypothetical protein